MLRNVSQSWKEGEGLVQICWMGQWRFVCDDGWDINAARVFCREHFLLTEGKVIIQSVKLLTSNFNHWCACLKNLVAR